MTQLEYSVENPLNREPKVDQLLSSYITTTDKEPYNRNHGPIPHLDASTHKITIDGCVQTAVDLSVHDLKQLPQHDVLCALQCAGNRRYTMRTLLKDVQGIDWFDGAVMNCQWRGPRLREVLQKAAVEESMRGPDGKWQGHVAFACYETEVQEDSWYGGSIELQRAMSDDDDCILALEMNGEPLTAGHGAPVRAIVPGVAGARSVKWLNRITVQAEESTNFYQRHDYKVLPPEATDTESAEKFWSKTPAMTDMPINSVVGLPATHSTVHLDEDGKTLCKGYAVPHGSTGPVVKVEVSGDEGNTWVEATLNYGEGIDPTDPSIRQKIRWAWCLWEARVKVAPGKERRVLSRATDFQGTVQPEDCEWNLRGVGYNAWGEARGLTVV